MGSITHRSFGNRCYHLGNHVHVACWEQPEDAADGVALLFGLKNHAKVTLLDRIIHTHISYVYTIYIYVHTYLIYHDIIHIYKAFPSKSYEIFQSWSGRNDRNISVSMGSPDLFVTGLGRKLVVFHLPPVLTKLFNMCNMSMSVNDCQCILHEASRVHQNWNPAKDCTSCRMSCTMLQTARDSNTFCCSAPPNFVLRNNSERRQTSRWNPAVAVGCRVRVWQGHQLQATPRLQIVKLKMVCLWPLRLQELRIHDKMGWLTSEMSKWLASVSAKTVLPTNPYSLWGLPTIDSLQDPSLSPVSFCGCHMWNDCYCRAHGGHLLTQVQSCTVSALSHANAQGLNIWFLLLGAGSGSPKRWKHLIKVVWIGLEREFMGLHHVLGWTPCRLRWVVNQKLMRASGDLDRLWAATSMVYRLPAASRHNFSQLYKL